MKSPAGFDLKDLRDLSPESWIEKGINFVVLNCINPCLCQMRPAYREKMKKCDLYET